MLPPFLASLPVHSLDGPSMTPMRPMQSLRDLIRPRPDELHWLRIPWETCLGPARARAASEDKPLLLWNMDGNPLGCT